jgi:hypothetical protein
LTARPTTPKQEICLYHNPDLWKISVLPPPSAAVFC